MARPLSMEVERYRVLDVFVLYPELLGRMRMLKADREALRELPIARLQDMFIRLPSIASVYQSLLIYQDSALTQLAAKGIVDPSCLKSGLINVAQSDMPSSMLSRAADKNIDDGGVIEFVTGPIAEYPLKGSEGMFRRCGIPQRVVALS